MAEHIDFFKEDDIMLSAVKLYQKGFLDMSELEMRQIEVFLCAARHQNISRAAEALSISQPALSKAISKMEKDFGAPLFDRTNRGVVLTDEGQELYTRLDFEYHRFRVSIQDIIRHRRLAGKSALMIGSLNREVVWLMARENTQAYALQHPDEEIALERYDADSLRRKLLCGELDLILTRDSELLPAAEFDRLTICEYPVFFIVPQSLADKGLEALNEQPLFLESPLQRRRAETVCNDYGIAPSDVRYAESYSMLLTRMIRDGGFSIDGRMALSGAETAGIAYLPIRRAFHERVVLAWRKEAVSPAVTDFTAFLDPVRSGTNLVS